MNNFMFFLLIVLFQTSCSEKKDLTDSKISLIKVEQEVKDSVAKFALDTLSLKNAKFNGKPLFFSLNDLKPQKIDSIQYNLWECGHPFEWMDKDHPADSIRSIYVNNIEYITNENKVLVFAAEFNEDNKLELRDGIKINRNTSIKDFKLVFPLSYQRYLEDSKKAKNDELAKIYVGFTKDQPEDHWVFYFKNGLVFRFELYWWLC